MKDNRTLVEKLKSLFIGRIKMNISLERWEHTCGDGCCYRTGYDVYINDKHIGFTEGEDAEDLVELLNEWFETKIRLSKV